VLSVPLRHAVSMNVGIRLQCGTARTRSRNRSTCGRYDTYGNLHPYCVNAAIAERRCRANPSESDAKAILTSGLRWSAKGRSLPKWVAGAMSVLLPIATEERTSREVRKVPILLQKPFLTDKRIFLGPLVRCSCCDVRDHIVSHRNDHRPPYRSYRALQRRRPLKIDIREIFGVARFSTFATVSATCGLVHRSNFFDFLVGAAVCRPLPLKQPFSVAAALRIAPIEDLGAGDASVYGVSPCTRCMLTMLPLGTTLPAIGD
jgi:hypothetical protein